MTTPAERAVPDTRDHYRHLVPIATRWMDNDAYGHVNNVVYYSWFDTVVNRWLIEAGVLDVARGAVIGLVVETHCNYFSPITFPQAVHAGLRVARIGGSSVRYEVGIFADDARLAAARRNHPRLARTAVSPSPEQAAIVDAAITSRRSLRAFLPTPVPRETVEQILSVASRAPSGTNTQPWKVYVLSGEPKAQLSKKILAAYDDPAERAGHTEEYAYYPTEWRSPFIDRRRKIGWDLYGLLQIGKTDKARMHAQHGRNYAFFDAPVGLIFTIDRVLQQGSWLDYGMFLQSIMVAARGRGLDTCPQAAFMQFHRIITEHVGATANEQLVCGMSLGHADPAAVENSLVTEREPVASFARFLD